MNTLFCACVGNTNYFRSICSKNKVDNFYCGIVLGIFMYPVCDVFVLFICDVIFSSAVAKHVGSCTELFIGHSGTVTYNITILKPFKNSRYTLYRRSSNHRQLTHNITWGMLMRKTTSCQ